MTNWSDSGENETPFVHVTITVQVPPTGMLAEIQFEVFTWKSPLSLKSTLNTLPIDSGDVPVFLIVTVCGGLVPSLGSGPKVRFCGVTLANGPLFPVPASVTGCGLSPALSVKFSAP